MKSGKALMFGVLGAAAISALSAVLRLLGLPINLELMLGTLTGAEPSAATFMLGLGIHLAVGALFGLLYGWLFERVWDHGGASTGMILGVIHAAIIGMAVGLAPQFHPLIPERMSEPGPFFGNLGIVGVVGFFALHLVYGAVVGAGYGHVAAEHEWAPEGRL